MRYRLSIFCDHSHRLREGVGLWLTVIFLAVVYVWGQIGDWTNLADADDLVLASNSFGLAHAPGYPLQILSLSWGKVFGYGWITTLISLINGALVYQLLVDWLKRYRSDKNQGNQIVWSAMTASLTFGLSMTTLRHALIPEVFPLTITWILILWWRVIRREQRQNIHARKDLMVDGLLIILAWFSHQLSLLICLPLAIYSWSRVKPQLKTGLIVLGSGLVLSAVIIVLMFKMSQSQGYSWPITISLKGLYDFLSRSIYAPGGSQIEIYSRSISIDHSLRSIMEMGKNIYENFSYSLVLGLGGIWWWLKREKKSRIWLGYGLGIFLGLIFYLKFPLASWATDTEYYWGSGLRYRMYYGFDLGLAVLTGFGTYGLLSFKRRLSNLMGALIIGFTLVLGLSRVYGLSLTPQNGLHRLSREILTNLPNNAVMMVDGDMIFAFLLDQQVDMLRQDVKVISTQLPITPKSWEYEIDPDVLKLIQAEMDNNRRYAMISVQLLKSGKRLFWFNPEAKQMEILGVEGNPLFIYPYGYVFEIRMNNQFAESPQTTFTLSKELSQIKTNDWWILGMRGYLAEIHAQLMYYYARLGNEKEAFINLDLAKSLAALPTTQNEINKTWEIAEQLYRQNGSYANYVTIGAEEYFNKSQQARNEGLNQEARYFYDRASILAPEKYPQTIRLGD